MVPLRRPGARIPPAAVFGVVGLALLAASGTFTGTTPAAHGAPAANVAPVAPRMPASLLVWTSDRLVSGLAGAVAGFPAVASALPVVGATVWLTGSHDASGKAVDAFPAGQAVPFDLRAADLTAYANFVPVPDRATFAGLRDGEVLLGSTSAGLRRLGVGGTITVGGRTLRIAGVVPDAEVGTAEAFTTSSTAALLGVTTQRYLLVAPKGSLGAQQLAALVRTTSIGSAKLGVESTGPNLGPDYSVLPQVLEKKYFGEFVAHLPSGSGGWMTLSSAWTSAHLKTESVPILGDVTCNAAMLPALRSALAEVVSSGLSNLVNPHDYGGCFAARLVAGPTTDDISHHAWGSAIDLNVSKNPAGGASQQDPRLVAIFQKWGFTWGGNWLSPDPMHFELQVPGESMSAG
jgi:hypothetical protein